MARPLQKKKNKSSLPRVRQKPKSKRISIKSNPIVAAAWNKSLTLSQNYHRLGLSSKLNASTGGTEFKTPQKDDAAEKQGDLAIPSSKARKAQVGSVKVVRDETGRITGVVPDGESERKRKRNPLNDPMNDLSDSDPEEEEGRPAKISKQDTQARGIVAELEESSRYEKAQRPRKMSQRDREWLGRLVGRYGEDFGAMARDRRMNPMQQTEGDLKRRVVVWMKEEGRRDQGAGGEGG